MSVPVAQVGHFKLPKVENEVMKNYAPGSPERSALEAAVKELRSQAPITVPCIVNGKEITSGPVQEQLVPSEHKTVLAKYHDATPDVIESAIQGALEAKEAWELMPWNDRAAIFLKAADLISTKYRYKLMAATMLGQGKNAWQAEIDAAAELCDFFRFNCKYAEELYSQQPPMNAPGVWNRSEYRPLEGFVFAVSPFNFTAIGGNLPGAPALMGNVVIWKPAPAATYSNYLVYKILEEAGLPAGVIQFTPGPAPEVVSQVLASPDFASLHFTGSTLVFRKLWKDIGNNIDKYRSYPRVVGETGGKNFHLVHSSADIKSTVIQTIRGAFEYSGQKCSATSRLYVAKSVWEKGFKDELVSQTSHIKVGAIEDWTNFMGPVINKASFDKIKKYVEDAKASGTQILSGGEFDDSKGYFVRPTILVAKTPNAKTMVDEIFGPVLTVYVYPDEEFTKMFKLIEDTTQYALTGSIFAQDRAALSQAATGLRRAAGNFYINDKCTGAIVGQQPFGGSAGSGTCDKAGSINLLYRFVSARSIKENFLPVSDYQYPSNFQ